MSDASRPRLARRGILPAGVLAAALIALLAVAPFASAAPDPLSGGKTTMTLEKSFTNYLKTFGISVSKISPAKLSGQTATFSVTGGSLDPTTGKGTVNLGGGLKFKAGKANAQVKALVIDTSKKSLTAKVSGKKVKLATIAGWSSKRNGFGATITIKKVKLTNAGATQLNKKLGFSKGKPKPFLGNKLIAKASAEAQPGTTTVLPGGNVTFAATLSTLKKLTDVEVKITPIAPTAVPSLGSFLFPITGGTVSPLGTAGTVESSSVGGVLLEQILKFPAEVQPPLVTRISLNGFSVDLAAKTVKTTVTAQSNASKELNLGTLPSTSIADIVIPGVVADSAARTVTVNNAPATLQTVSGAVLNGFVQVYEGYKKALGTPEAKPQIAAGESLGTFSFTAQGQ
ncbi:MAG TPA: HtaA domain-containing protein [Solirubrobacterales bacterium]|nr:HtaA domain-containing protein [Solirubrobacterales bacterium]